MIVSLFFLLSLVGCVQLNGMEKTEVLSEEIKIQVTVEELSLILDQFEKDIAQGKDFNVELFMQSIVNGKFSYPASIEDSMEFVIGLVTGFSEYLNNGDIKGFLAQINKEKTEILARSSRSAPIFEKVLQFYIKIALLPQVRTRINTLSPDYAEAARAALDTPGAQNFPIRRLCSLARVLSNYIPLERLALAAQNRQLDPLLALCGFDEEQKAAVIEYVEFLPLLQGLLESVAVPVATKDQGKEKENNAQKAIFPLNDDYFKQTSFRDLAQSAQRGELEPVTQFVRLYPGAKNFFDEKETNLLGHAILGYCKGVDGAWDVLAFLAQEGLDISLKIRTYLSTQENSNPAKNCRKLQVKRAVEAQDAFVETDEQPFFIFPKTPPVLQTGNGICCIS